MTKYLNVFWIFYGFVYDTSLEMCLNGNVLLWNLRDTCFCLISVFLRIELCCCIFWAGSICHGDWLCVCVCMCVWGGWSCQILRQSWDWSLLRSFNWSRPGRILKIFSIRTSESPLKPCTGSTNQISIQFDLTYHDPVSEGMDCAGVVSCLHCCFLSIPVSGLVELALSRLCPSSVCTNTDLSVLLSLHGGPPRPHVKCLPQKTPVTVPTDEPFCSASWWQSELFSSFQHTLCFTLGACCSTTTWTLSFYQTCCSRVRIQAVSRGTSPTRTIATLTSWDLGLVNEKPCLSVLARLFFFF